MPYGTDEQGVAVAWAALLPIAISLGLLAFLVLGSVARRKTVDAVTTSLLVR
jgi:hypothetical protein